MTGCEGARFVVAGGRFAVVGGGGLQREQARDTCEKYGGRERAVRAAVCHKSVGCVRFVRLRCVHRGYFGVREELSTERSFS